MSTIAEIRDGMAAALYPLFGSSATATETGSVTPPSATIVTPTIDYHRSFKGSGALGELGFRVIVCVSATITDAAARELDTYADPTSDTSLKAALELDPTLGGVAESLIVDSFRPLDVEEVAAIGYWGGEFAVRVFAR